jgi:hypothetical protein
MKKTVLLLMGVIAVAMLCGCGVTMYRAPLGKDVGVKADMTAVRPDRMLIWKANLSIEVWNISNAVKEASSMAERAGGFVEQKSDHGDESASLTLRIPAKAFKTTLSDLEILGSVTYRSIEGEDVTEQYIDVEARLKNKVVLRDRLKQLLEKATEVKEILAIETELNRVQADIDSMEGRIKSLKGQVEYATVRLSLERKQILGPLGYLFKGLWWGVEKLFVIRE